MRDKALLYCLLHKSRVSDELDYSSKLRTLLSVFKVSSRLVKSKSKYVSKVDDLCSQRVNPSMSSSEHTVETVLR